MDHRFRVLLVILAILLFCDCALFGADETFSKTVQPFLNKHCLSCHGTKKQEGGVRFDNLDGITIANRNIWTTMHEKILSGEMPPKGSTKVSDEDRKLVTNWMKSQQRELGIGGSRRLNRRELNASLQDLTGLKVEFSQALPNDGTVAGFDTGAEALLEASDAVAQWLTVTRRAVEGVRFIEPNDNKVLVANLQESKDIRKTLDALKTDGLTYKMQGVPKTGMGLLIEPRAVGEREESSFSLPIPSNRQSILRVTLLVSAYKPLEKIPSPHLWVRIGGKDLDFREVTGTLEKPQKLVYEVHLGDLAINKGISITLANRVEIPYSVEGFENEDKTNPKDTNPAPGGTGLFRPAFDRKTTPVDKQPVPFIALQSIEMETLQVIAWPPQEWKANLGELKDNPESAKRLLDLWIERAWRRPVSEPEKVPFIKLYEKQRKAGESFDAALRAALQATLIAAPFRYMGSPGNSDPVVSQHAIASRLSFMLWGTPPDTTLRTLALQGKLREPKVLETQVDRLLSDPKSEAFIRPFVTQWLEMEQPITIAQSHISKQDFRFARYLKESLKNETIFYIGELVKENRPAKEIIQSDWTMMNNTSSRHYEYPPLEGSEMRRVKLKPADPRGGGILGHAGVQSMLCWMGDNWVIYRGAWAMRHILDQPPPPPPLEVPELNPSEGKNKGKPFRELLKQHQEDAKCAVCHKNMDPVGFAFQNFDLSGRWRDVEHESYARSELDGRIAWLGVGKTRPVDASGNLPRGEEFKTFGEFKQQLVKHYQDDLVRGLMKNFTVYATGRKPNIDDMAEIASTMKEAKAKDYPLRELIKGVVNSSAFLEENELRRNKPSSKSEPKKGDFP